MEEANKIPPKKKSNVFQFSFLFPSPDTHNEDDQSSPPSQTEEQPPIANDEDDKALAVPDEPPEIPKIHFKCELCRFNELCEYKGTSPPFAKKIELREECYVMQDPFSPPPGKLSDKSNSEYFIVLGADCVECHRMVCAAETCSIFYAQTFCLQCAYQRVKQFPLEIQSKIRKLVASTTLST